MLLCPFWQLAGTDELSTTDTFGSLSAITKKKTAVWKKILSVLVKGRNR
jgi:hypothetical protein